MSLTLPIHHLLADIAWRPGFGARWIWWISAAQLVAAWLCFSAGRRERGLLVGNRDSRSPMFWNILAAFMFALCLNKLFDLQSLLTIVVRKTARLDGWYAQRRSIQAGFVLASAVVGLICLAASFYVLRGHWKQRGLACVAAVFLLALIMIRTASYHPMDALLYGLPGIGNRMNAGLELGGTVLVSIGTLLASVRRRVHVDGGTRRSRAQ